MVLMDWLRASSPLRIPNLAANGRAGTAVLRRAFAQICVKNDIYMTAPALATVRGVASHQRIASCVTGLSVRRAGQGVEHWGYIRDDM